MNQYPIPKPTCHTWEFSMSEAGADLKAFIPNPGQFEIIDPENTATHHKPLLADFLKKTTR